jgi:hypothetical protein
MSASTPPGYELLRTTACDGRYYKVALGEADFDHEYAAHEYAALAHSVLNGWRHGLCDWVELAPMLRALAPNSRPTQADPDRPHARRLAPGAPRLAQRLVLRDAIRGVTLIFLPFEGMTAAGDVFVNKQPLQGLVRVHTGMAAANGAAVAGHATARWGEGTLLPRLEELLAACWTPPPGANLEVTVRACLLRRSACPDLDVAQYGFGSGSGGDEILFALEAPPEQATLVTKTFGRFLQVEEQGRRGRKTRSGAGVFGRARGFNRVL